MSRRLALRRPASRPALIGLVLAGLVALAGCTAGATDGSATILQLEVAAERVACVGEMAGSCLQVRAPGETEWRRFYSPIDGFTWEAGYRYTLRVRRIPVPDPPADGSSFRYELVRVLARDSVG